MKILFLFAMALTMTLSLTAQQLVLPDELTPKQQKIFKRITEDVSAPCCNNAIPVAYHDSGMAVYIREFVTEKLLEGKSEDEVMDEVMALRLGSENQPVIRATPEGKGLGIVAWAGPFVLLLLMGGFILSRRSTAGPEPLGDDDLIARYRPQIHERLGKEQEAPAE